MESLPVNNRNGKIYSTRVFDFAVCVKSECKFQKDARTVELFTPTSLIWIDKIYKNSHGNELTKLVGCLTWILILSAQQIKPKKSNILYYKSKI